MELYTIHRVGLLLLSIGLLGVVLELVRRDLLKERYALLWLVTALTGVVVGVYPKIVIGFCDLFSFQYVTAFFVLSFLFLLGLVLSFSIVISRLSLRNRRLTQELALVEYRVRALEKQANVGRGA